MIPYRQRESELSFAMIIDFLREYRWPIIIVTLTAGILAAIFSSPYFMPPKYESKVILYPSTTNSISKGILDITPGAKTDFLAFGEETEAEQLLQMLQSDFITNRVIQKYDLMKHYRIDKNSDFPYTQLVKEFNGNVSYRRTEYASIEISVLDESPDTAARIANDISALVDTAKNNVQKQRAREALAIVEKKYFEKMAFINQLVDSLQKIGKLGVYNAEQQSSVLDEQYANALSSNNARMIKALETQREMLGKYGPVQKALTDRIEYENEELARLRTKYEQAKVDADQMLPASFVINKATPAEKKAYPIRSLIVLISMGSAFAASVLLLALLKNYKEYKKQKALEQATAAIANTERSLIDA